MPWRNVLVFSSRRSRSSVVSLSMSRHSMDADTTAGGSVLEKRYGRALLRIHAMTSRLPAMQPPLAPPSALP